MTDSKLTNFVLKMCAVFFVVCSVVFMFLKFSKLMLISGLALGTLASILIFIGLSISFSKSKSGYPMFMYCAGLLSVFILLVIAYSIGTAFFIGCIAGTLAVPTVFNINSVTEAAGITRNGFYI